jgi:pimeloyl-ACP methyl ester carboxylesterase
LSLERGRVGTPSTGGPGVTRFARRGDHRLSYESSGPADGIPVLALHDLLADRGQLRALAEAPHNAVFRVTLPDARGHGAAPMLSGRRYPSSELAADALAVIDAEGLAAVHLAAIGWGAAAALAITEAAPERVMSLVLVTPYLPVLLSESPDAAAQRAGRDHLEMMREAATAAEKGQMERALDLFLVARIGAGWRDRLSPPRLGAIRRAAGNLAPLLAGMAADTITLEALKSLDTSATLLVREDASFLDLGTVDALASVLPRSRIAAVPPPPLDQQASGSEWTEAISQALLEHAARQDLSSV